MNNGINKDGFREKCQSRYIKFHIQALAIITLTVD
jgi:hypothetical protein